VSATSHITNSPQETRALAARLASRWPAGTVVALHGELGAGKTCFAQGLAEGLGVDRAVNSPTYTLVSEYKGSLPLYHLDLYRISGPEAAYGMGIEDYLASDGITVIEWAERIAALLPPHTIHVRIEPGADPTSRVIQVLEVSSS